jgi:hypothetical protein
MWPNCTYCTVLYLHCPIYAEIPSPTSTPWTFNMAWPKSQNHTLFIWLISMCLSKNTITFILCQSLVCSFSSCVGLREYLASDLDKYHCPRCEPVYGPSLRKCGIIASVTEQQVFIFSQTADNSWPHLTVSFETSPTWRARSLYL